MFGKKSRWQSVSTIRCFDAQANTRTILVWGNINNKRDREYLTSDDCIFMPASCPDPNQLLLARMMMQFTQVSHTLWKSRGLFICIWLLCPPGKTAIQVRTRRNLPQFTALHRVLFSIVLRLCKRKRYRGDWGYRYHIFHLSEYFSGWVYFWNSISLWAYFKVMAT